MIGRRIVLLAVLLCSCSTPYAYTPIGQSNVAPRPPDCTFHLVGAWAYPGYEQIGIIEFSANDSRRPARTKDDFYWRIRPIVCEAGGEVVVTAPNGWGYYMGGLVLRRP